MTSVTMKPRTYSTLHISMTAAIIPLVAVALYVGIVRLVNLDRYDPAYFTPEMVSTYSTPRSVAGKLAEALETNDQAALAQLEGLRHPVAFAPGETLSIELLRKVETSSYFMVMIASRKAETYKVYQLGPARGRWVVVPEDDFYIVDSGRWAAIWLPLALIWWLIEVSTLIVLGVRTILLR